MIGSIHADGWSILEKKNYDVIEITDFGAGVHWHHHGTRQQGAVKRSDVIR